MAFIEKLEASWQNPLQSRTTAGVIIKDSDRCPAHFHTHQPCKLST